MRESPSAIALVALQYSHFNSRVPGANESRAPQPAQGKVRTNARSGGR